MRLNGEANKSIKKWVEIGFGKERFCLSHSHILGESRGQWGKREINPIFSIPYSSTQKHWHISKRLLVKSSPYQWCIKGFPLSLNILVRDVINLLYYEYWTDKQKYFYVHSWLFYFKVNSIYWLPLFLRKGWHACPVIPNSI